MTAFKSFKTLLSVPLAATALFLAGCDKDKDKDNEREPAAASTTATNEPATGAATVAPAERPAELAAATDDIKNGRLPQAQQRLESFLAQDQQSVYRAEAHYLLGQSLAAQGRHDAGKKQLDKAIDATDERTLKALAMLGRADCNMALKNYSLASRQYHWLELMYRDVKAIPQDELMFKLGLACKKAHNTDLADYWLKQVVELYATGPYVEPAKREHSKYTPTDPNAKPLVYSLEVSVYGKREKAETEAQALRDKGYKDIEVIETTRNSNPTFEVHMGKYQNRSDAFRAQTDAELAGLPTHIRPATIEPLK